MREIPEKVRRVLTRLEGAGYEAWCVGGAVRDALLGREPGDWDVTTDALPEQVMALFGPSALPTGLKHGTVTVGGGRGVEVTTYRVDGTYSDHRRPDAVAFTRRLEEDLARRDFTVNAMALSLRGELRDPFGGQADLEKGVLRAVGDPRRRLEEDALRILRGLRFASKLGFSLEPDTAEAMGEKAPLLRKIAPERLRTELEGLLLGDHAARVLLEWPKVLGVFLPEVLPAVGLDQRTPYHCYDVWEHTARSVEASPPDPVVRWTMLLHDLGKPDTFTVDEAGTGHFYGHGRESARHASDVMDRLRFDNQRRRDVLLLVERHDCALPLTEKAVRRNLAKYGEVHLRRLLAVKRADNLAQAPACRDRQTLLDQWEALLDAVLASEDCFSLKKLAVKGNDLTALGLSGPAVGRALDALLDLVMDEALPNRREALLDYVKEALL